MTNKKGPEAQCFGAVVQAGIEERGTVNVSKKGDAPGEPASFTPVIIRVFLFLLM